MSFQDNRSIQSYVIQDKIAGGGMGHIYRAIKKGIGGFEKQVVLKQLLPELTKDTDLVELFFREAQIHAVLDHANIVHIIDLVGDGKNYFIVMEYIRGTDLYRVIRRCRKIKRRFPVPAALYVGMEILKGLGYAHEKKDEKGIELGIVHRDVSPTNVMLSEAGEVKITDFGIAKAKSYATDFFRVRGKAAYMSPEQATGEDIDKRSDIYSTAVCIYEMISGTRPFPSPKKGWGAVAHYSQPIAPLAGIRRNIPKELDDILLSALAFDPGERPGSAGRFISLLEKIVVRWNLHYSGMKLAALLKLIFGEDTETWSNSAPSGSFNSDVSPSGSSDYKSHGKHRLSGDHLSRRRGVNNEPCDLKGMEIASVKNSLFEGIDFVEGRVSPRLSLPPPPPSKQPKNLVSHPYHSEKRVTSEAIEQSSPSNRVSGFLFWPVFLLGLGLVGLVAFLLVVWFASCI